MTLAAYIMTAFVLFIGATQLILLALAYSTGERPVIREAWQDVIASWAMGLALIAVAFWLFAYRLA